MGRLKALRSKELAFMAAGIATLLMAPLAEHFLSSQGEEQGTLRSGFDHKDNVFSDSRAYEDGISGIAPGGLVGQGDGMISPLNASDPTALVISPDGEEQPAAPPVRREAAAPPRTSSSSGWKDALATAATRGAAKATRQVRLPMPGGKLASKISSLSSNRGSGSSGASLHALAPISSKGLVSDRPDTGSNLSRVAATKDYRGAGRSLSSGAGGSPGAGFLQSGKSIISGGSGASSSASSGGAGVSGSNKASVSGSAMQDIDGKLAGASAAGDNKNVGVNQKEDLAFLKKKMEMEKAISHKWEKKKYDEIERKKMLEQMAAQTASQAALKVLDKLLSPGGGEQGSGGGGSSGAGGGGSSAARPENSGIDPLAAKRTADYTKYSMKAGEIKGSIGDTRNALMDADIKSVKAEELDALGGDSRAQSEDATGNKMDWDARDLERDGQLPKSWKGDRFSGDNEYTRNTKSIDELLRTEAGRNELAASEMKKPAAEYQAAEKKKDEAEEKLPAAEREARDKETAAKNAERAGAANASQLKADAAAAKKKVEDLNQTIKQEQEKMDTAEADFKKARAGLRRMR